MPRKAKPTEATPEPSNHNAAATTASENDIAIPAANGDKDNLPGNANDKIRQLTRQAKEQGYLTFDDINEALPEAVDNPEEIENVISILQNLEIDILDPDEVEGFKQKQEEAEEEETRYSQNDILDDPVRMYLKQMGAVPLLTREQ